MSHNTIDKKIQIILTFLDDIGYMQEDIRIAELSGLFDSSPDPDKLTEIKNLVGKLSSRFSELYRKEINAKN